MGYLVWLVFLLWDLITLVFSRRLGRYRLLVSAMSRFVILLPLRHVGGSPTSSFPHRTFLACIGLCLGSGSLTYLFLRLYPVVRCVGFLSFWRKGLPTLHGHNHTLSFYMFRCGIRSRLLLYDASANSMSWKLKIWRGLFHLELSATSLFFMLFLLLRYLCFQSAR